MVLHVKFASCNVLKPENSPLHTNLILPIILKDKTSILIKEYVLTIAVRNSSNTVKVFCSRSCLRFRGVPVVIDWKLSEKPKKDLKDTYDAPVQITAYMGALNHDPNYKWKVS